MGILMRGRNGVSAAKEALHQALADASPYVRVVAAEAWGRYGSDEDAAKALGVLLEAAPPDKNGVFPSILALNVLDALDDRAKSAASAIEALPRKDPSAPPRTGGYVPRLIEKTLSDLEE